ncbi:MAG: dockerin type I domain-containing protein [Planctomycetota bacterium]
MSTTVPASRSVRSALLFAGIVAAALLAPSSALADGGKKGGGATLSPMRVPDPRIIEDPVGMTDTPWLLASPDFKAGEGAEGGVAGGCPQVISTHTNASFEGGQYVVQAGFAELEIAACSYTLTAADFPLRIDLVEMIFATSNATVQTTTKWTVMVWEGVPNNGNLVYAYSSNGVDLPHLVMQPGTNGTNIAFSIDPNDPEQMIVQDNGSRTFTVGYRIDDHNNQTQDPCLIAPPSSSNAFPTTDVGGLQSPSNNWLFALNCGAFGCPAGWRRFSELPTGCRPSGDWVMRVTWTPQNCEVPGACCLPNATCQSLTESLCAAQGGTFAGAGTTCTASTCTQNICPCCFPSTGGCVTLSPASCTAAGGIAGPTGQSCTGYVCFPTGACCLPNGSCIGPVSPAQCSAQGGVFQGNATTCTPGLCPEPMGAACFPNGFCLMLTQNQAASAGATWKGPGTTCADANGNGTADACELDPADLNGDGIVNASDLSILLGAWGSSNPVADINDDGSVNASDLSILLGSWG